MLWLASLTRKINEIPALQLSRSCTENFGDQNILPEIVSREESVNTWRLLVTHLRAVVRACLGGADHFRLADDPDTIQRIHLN